MRHANKKHVLLVGGDTSWVSHAKTALHPFETSWVDDGDNAIALLESRSATVDALLSHNKSASAILKWTRINREELPVIVMPSQNLDEDAFFLELGALSVVRPHSAEKLTTLLDIYFALGPN
jgi:hypothetical protein